MLESILSNIVVLVLGGGICKLFYNRLNRLEDKVDWLIKSNGGDYKPKQKKPKGGDNE